MTPPPLAALRLVVAAAPRRAVLVLALEVLGSVLATAQVVAAASLVGGVLAVVRTHASLRDLALPLAALAVVTLLGSVATSATPRSERLLGEEVSRATWARVLDVSARVPLVAYDTPEFADALHRVRDHGLAQPVAIASALARLTGGCLTLGALVGYLFSVNLSLPLLALVAGVPTLVTTRVLGRREFAFAHAQALAQRRRVYLAGLLSDRESAKEVRAFGLGRWLTDRHDAALDGYLRAMRRHLGKQAWLESVGAVLTSLLSIATLLVLVLLVRAGSVDLAHAAGAALALRLLAGRAVATAGGMGALYQSGLFLADLQTFLAADGLEAEVGVAPGVPTQASSEGTASRPPVVVDVTGQQRAGVGASSEGTASRPPVVVRLPGGPGSPSYRPHVALRGVGFTYPGASRPAVEGVDLELAPGRVIALVGENGSGKTTLAKVVAQLYAPTQGEVRWDGAPVGDARRAQLRPHVAVLFQDFARYAFTVEQNITVGDTRAAPDPGRLQAALAASGLTDVVDRLPQGVATPLGAEFGGHDLSVGQWQRLALARAHYRQAPLVVLDEPTASLDPRAEAELFADVRTVLAGRTVLLITHRLASARTADEVVVLRGGRIHQRGTHDDLVDVPGVYAELWRLQASAYADALGV